MDIEWRANKRNNFRRVSVYSNPGVHEVIYNDEWVNKKPCGLPKSNLPEKREILIIKNSDGFLGGLLSKLGRLLK